VACFEARVEAAVGSEAGVEAVVDSEARDEVKVCSGPGSRTAGSGGTMVSRATEERESAGSKNC
jgi:hypothetical protein